MNSRVDTERILDVFLAPEADRLPDRVIEATLDELARTRQRRAPRVPWRFPIMPALSRSTGIAAVVLVAVVGVGGLIYLNSTSGNASGGTAATPTPTIAPSPAPSEVAPGITGWKDYRSTFYSFQLRYPSDWTVYSAATRAWKASDGTANSDAWPYADVFANPERVDGGSIGVFVWEMPAGEGTQAESVEGLKAWAKTFCTDSGALRDVNGASCDTFTKGTVPMCLDAGGDPCRAAIIVPTDDGVYAFFENWTSAVLSRTRIRVVSVGRPDDFSASARYGGSAQLLKSILTSMDVTTPQAGQVPGG